MILKEIEKIIQIVENAKEVIEFEWERNKEKIRIRKRGCPTDGTNVQYFAPSNFSARASVPVPSAEMFEERASASAEKATPVHEGNSKEVLSPFVGTFYAASSPDSPKFTDVGKRVKKGDVLCIIEAMKIMNEIEAEFDGVVEAILVKDGQPVQYGQPLFLVNPK